MMARNNALLALRRYLQALDPNMQAKLFSVRRALAPIAGGLALVTSAHATYTVIDDDLYPTAALMARDRISDSSSTEKFKVIFNRGSSVVGPNARLYIDDLIARIQVADQIRIIGRPDSAAATNNKQQRSLGMARAYALRAYLVKAGIPSSSIEVEMDSNGNPLAASGISPAEIVITTLRDYRPSFADQAPVQQERAIPRTYRYLNQDAEPRPAPAVSVRSAAEAPQQALVTRSPSDERLVQYINQAVQTGQMLPAVAVQILRSLAEANFSSVTAQQSPIAPVASPQALAAPAPGTINRDPMRADRWVLDARLTLKDNVDKWSEASGWKPTDWRAGNFYQVTTTTTLDGAFPDVLKRIADSTGLNICAIPREKLVRVTDATVPCDKK